MLISTYTFKTYSGESNLDGSWVYLTFYVEIMYHLPSHTEISSTSPELSLTPPPHAFQTHIWSGVVKLPYTMLSVAQILWSQRAVRSLTSAIVSALLAIKLVQEKNKSFASNLLCISLHALANGVVCCHLADSKEEENTAAFRLFRSLRCTCWRGVVWLR